jgi:hypothetical protein
VDFLDGDIKASYYSTPQETRFNYPGARIYIVYIRRIGGNSIFCRAYAAALYIIAYGPDFGIKVSFYSKTYIWGYVLPV